MSTISNSNFSATGDNPALCLDCLPGSMLHRRPLLRNRRAGFTEATTSRPQISRREPSNYDKVMDIAEKISVLALGVLSAMADYKLFIPFFIGGLGYGIYSSLNNENTTSHQVGSACSQGFLEQITGIRLPRPVSLIANVAITACHIDHHSSVFVPITALSFGAWVGKNGVVFSKWATQQATIIQRALQPLTAEI